MAIEVDCTGCKKRLRVEDKHAGRRVRCPECQAVSMVPQSVVGEDETGPDSDSAEQDSSNWHLQTPEGQIYGPVPKSELDSWVAEGRVSAACQVRQRDERDWHSAADVYPILLVIPSPSAVQLSSNLDSDEHNPIVAKNSKEPDVFVQPHRGSIVLVLGVLGWCTLCFVLGLIACVMGWRDLHAMKEGRMQRDGRTLTQIGMIFGLIQCIFFALGFATWIVSLVMRAVGSIGPL